MVEKSEIEIIIKKCIKMLEHIAKDKAVPRNIRRNVNEVVTTLQDNEKPLFIRISHSTSILEDVSIDPNIPLHTRTLIWNAASQLETLPVDE
ncbi:MAG: hypothetical protein HF967_08500 [Methanosarcinales archaeon]|nr:hypothetical protein [Methanosarcinales archaeon]